MERLHTDDGFAIVVPFAVDQDRGNPNITRAFDIGCRFVADVTGLIRRHACPLERFPEYAGVWLGRTDNGGGQDEIKIRCQTGVLQNFRQARIPIRDHPQHHSIILQLIEQARRGDILEYPPAFLIAEHIVDEIEVAVEIVQTAMRREHPAHQLLPERALHCQATLPAQGFHAAHVGPLLLELAVEIVCAPGEPEVTGVRGIHIAHGRMHAEQSATDIKKHGFIILQHRRIFYQKGLCDWQEHPRLDDIPEAGFENGRDALSSGQYKAISDAI